MRLRKLSLTIAFLTAGTLTATAQTASPLTGADTKSDFQPQKRDAVACEGPFAKDTTHAKLVAAFGGNNVTFKDVDGAEGATEKATVLFDTDPTHRIVVFWHDAKARTKPSMITISAPSLWIGPGGIGNGMKLTDVEKLNGKPFKLAGFDWDGGGFIRELDGKLKAVADGCNLVVRFEPGVANPLPVKYAEIIGDKIILSTNRTLRHVRPQVSEWSIGYPE